MLSPRKRPSTSQVPDGKRKALSQISQLASPPTTPEKKSVVNIAAHISGHARKLQLCPESIYSRAKGLFQRGAPNLGPESLVGREKEAQAFSQFLRASLSSRKCSSLYVSGPPGTGKTAQVNRTLDALCKGANTNKFTFYGSQVLLLRVNCMAVPKAENIFHEICVHLTGESSGRKKAFDDLYELLLGGTGAIDTLVVVLDEMDYLITKDQQVLFQLFHCASHMKSDVFKTKLVLIGISNALDLTDKFLPRLRSNGFNPESIQFMPYTGDQIRQVITSKLRSLVEEDKENVANVSLATPLMHPAAIMLCCKKCAAVTGDLRKAFDICYKSIELVETQARQKETFAALTIETAPPVLISHVASVCASTFGDNSMSKVSSLNLLQKAVLCCLFSAESTHSKPLSVNELYDYYCKHTLECIEDMLGRLKKGDFLEIVGALESTLTVVLSSRLKACTGHVDVGNKIIRPNVSLADLQKCVEDMGVLRRILQVDGLHM